MTGTLPRETVCIVDPTQNMTPESIKAIFLPSLSPKGAAASDPKKHPACKSDTMFAENASEFSDRWKSLSERVS